MLLIAGSVRGRGCLDAWCRSFRQSGYGAAGFLRLLGSPGRFVLTGVSARLDETRHAVPSRSQSAVDEFRVLPQSLQRTIASNVRLHGKEYS